MQKAKDKRYIVRKFEQSPFNQDDLGYDIFILCDKKTNEPVAEIGPELPWYLRLKDTISGEFVKLSETSKKSKHLVVGDSVRIGHFYDGIIEKIEPATEDAYDWEDIFHIKDLKAKSKEALKFLTGMSEMESNQKFKREDCKHTPYLICEFNFSEKELWKKIEQDWIVYTDGYAPSYEEVMSFWKERTGPKK